MGAKLFVGSLSWDTTEATLRNAFEKFGEVRSATVITDRDSGRSRGFGFVEFANPNDADEALGVMNDTELDGRRIKVDMAQDKPRGNRGGGRGNGGGERTFGKSGKKGQKRGGGGGRGGKRDRDHDDDRGNRW